MSGVLEGVRVLDISYGIAGGMCGRYLADYGADVIKVEPPDGDPLRRTGPFFQNDPHPEKSLQFFAANLNKRGITLELGQGQGRQLYRDLVKHADVIVESFKPGHLSTLGLGYDELAQINPGVILTSITPFGQTGPYSHFQGEELIQYAMSGIMSISGYTDREPLKHGGSQAQYEAGLVGAVTTSFALFSQSMTGEGQHVDVSITEVVSSTLVETQPPYAFRGGVPGRRLPKGRMFTDLMPCKDGWVSLTAGGGRATMDDVADFFEKPELRDARFASPSSRMENGEELDTVAVDALENWSRWDYFHEAARRRLLAGFVQTVPELVECPHLESREFYREVEHPVMGRIKVPAVLFNYSDTPYESAHPAPLLGQHNEAVYGEELGLSNEDIQALRQQGVV